MTRNRFQIFLVAFSIFSVSISASAAAKPDSDLNQAYKEQEETYQKIKAYLGEESHLPSLTLSPTADSGYQIRLIKSKKKLTFVAEDSK